MLPSMTMQSRPPPWPTWPIPRRAISLADRKMAALEEWKTVGREVISSAQKHLAAVKTTHGKSHSWGGSGAITCKGGKFVLPSMQIPFPRELFELSVSNILPALAERLAKKRRADTSAGDEQEGEEEEDRLVEESEDEGWGEEEEAEEEEEEEEEEGEGEVVKRLEGEANPLRSPQADGRPARHEVEVPGLLRIATMSRREPLPRKPTASRKEDQKGFFEFKHAHDVHKKAKAAEEAAASTARAEAVRKAAEAAEAEAAKASRKMRKRKKKDEGVDVEAVAVAATARRARRCTRRRWRSGTTSRRRSRQSGPPRRSLSRARMRLPGPAATQPRQCRRQSTA